jgi:uncharacterized protein (DUF1501 family)
MFISSRRQFLNSVTRSVVGAGVAGAFGRLGTMSAYAQSSSSYRALVCVFLFGGNDANNTVIPISTSKNSYTDYSGVRRQVALSQSAILPIQAGSDTYGLHPALVDMQSIYQSGKLAIVTNVGTLAVPMSKTEYLAKTKKIPDNLFSHADQQGEAQTLTMNGSSATGWGGRVADLIGPLYNTPSAGSTLPFPAAISVAGNNIFSNGASSAPAMVTTSGATGLSNFPATPNARTTAFQNLLSFDNGLKLVQSANGITQSGMNDAKVLNAALASSTFNPTFPNTSIANQLKMVARVINVHTDVGAQRQIFFVSVGGYDNHDLLLNSQNTNLSQLNAALGAFFTSLQSISMDANVTTFVESDFSRTCQPNGSNGSDHAWGSHLMVMGGSVKGGVYGTFPTLALNGSDDVTGRGVYLPTTSLDQYGATLAKWFGVPPANLPSIFPNLSNFTTQDLGFLL